MNIRFCKITMDNFLSFGHAEIDLRDRGFTLVNGVNQNPDDNAQSNGSGKSAIWDAISWALTGTTIRGITKDIVNIHTTGGCAVELNFRIDGHDYVVKRYRDHSEFGSTIKFIVDNKDVSGKGVRDTEKIIQSYLPEVTSSLLGSVVILGQGLPQRFSNNTPSGRKEVLEKLSKSDFMIDDIKTRLATRKSELNDELRTTQDKILSLTSQETVVKQQLDSQEKDLSGLGEGVSEIEIQESAVKVTSIENELSLATERRDALQQQCTLVAEAISKIQLEQHTAEQDERLKWEEQINEARRKKDEISFSLQYAKNELKTIEDIKDICPTCGQKIPSVHKPNPEPIKVKIKELTELLNPAAKALADLSVQQTEAVSKIHKKYIDELRSKQSLQTKHNASLEEYKSIISKLTSDLIKAQQFHTALMTKYQTYETRKEELKASIETTKSRLTQLSDDIVYYKEKEESVKLHLDVISKMITIATRDFRGFLLTNVIKFIDEQAKLYAKDIFNTDKIQFVLNGNSIDIIYDDKNYESLSGGEKQRVDIIVQFALRDMLCKFSGFACNIIVLDELFDNIDAVGCDNVLNLITNRLNDIESVFIITHHSDISIPADSFITVYKDERGISSIR